MNTELLTWEDSQAVRTLLDRDPLTNLFLLTLLHPFYFQSGWWWGVRNLGTLEAVVFAWPDHYTLPFATSQKAARALAEGLRGQPLGLVMGLRETCDVLVDELQAPWARRLDHVMMVCMKATVLPGSVIVDGVNDTDVFQIAHHGAMMSLEDLGLDPRKGNAEGYHHHVLERIRERRTWVVREDEDIVFQVHMGYALDHAAQVGGTWTAPNRRGRGIASQAMGIVVDQLLTTFPCVILDVNETNVHAVACYRRVGFELHARMRIYTPRDDTVAELTYGEVL